MRRQNPEIVVRNVEILQLFKRGMNYSAIGKKFNLTRERVRQIINMEDFNLTKKKTIETHHRIILKSLEVIENDLPISTLYKEFNKSTVCLVFKKILGQTLKSLQMEKQSEKIFQLHKRGATINEIAKEMNLAYYYVDKLLTLAGLRPTRKLLEQRSINLLREYYTSTKSKREIERKFGVSRNTIYMLEKESLYKNNKELQILRKLKESL